MKYLNEFIDYLKKEGYEDKYFDSVDGYLINVDCYYQDKRITFSVSPTEEFEEFVKQKIKQEGEFEYDVDYKNYLVTAIAIDSSITTEQNFFDGSTGQIYLISNPDENSYHRHGFELFEKCVQLQKMGVVEHELFIMEKHIEHLRWAKKVLIPVLEKADYIIEYSSTFDVSDRRIDSNLIIVFKHYNDRKLDQGMYMETDCLTGECLFPNNLKLFGKTKEEVWNIMLEEVWKKADFTKRFSYLYTEGETKETFKEYLLELEEFRRKNYDNTKLQKSI